MTPADGGAAGDWIEWSGGKRPVDAETIVEVRLGRVDPIISEPQEAWYYLWDHSEDAVAGDYHVTAYRVVQP